MNDTTKQISQIDVNQIQQLSTTTLKAALSDTVQITAKYITLLSEIWKELERRGEDLSDLRSGIAYYLPLIAEKKLDASAVLAFAGQQLLLKEIAYLPVEKQIELSKGGEIPLVTVDSNGNYKTTLKKISSIHCRYYHQIFDTGVIRSEEEQIEYLKSQTLNKRKKNQVQTIKLNKEKGIVYFGNKQIKLDDFVKAAAMFSDKEQEDVIKFLNLS